MSGLSRTPGKRVGVNSPPRVRIPPSPPNARPLALRFNPGDDLRSSLTAVLGEQGVEAAFVLQGIGSLSMAQLRFAGAEQATELRGDLEILTLAGSLSPDGGHLHMSVSDAQGRVFGGHVAPGCLVRTTAELLLLLLPEHAFSREMDASTGYAELKIRHCKRPPKVSTPTARHPKSRKG